MCVATLLVSLLLSVEKLIVYSINHTYSSIHIPHIFIYLQIAQEVSEGEFQVKTLLNLECSYR